MSASYGFEIVAKEKLDEDGKVTDGAMQVLHVASGIMEMPTRESVLWAERAKLEEMELEPKDVEVYVTRPFGESAAS